MDLFIFFVYLLLINSNCYYFMFNLIDLLNLID